MECAQQVALPKHVVNGLVHESKTLLNSKAFQWLYFSWLRHSSNGMRLRGGGDTCLCVGDGFGSRSCDCVFTLFNCVSAVIVSVF